MSALVLLLLGACAHPTAEPPPPPLRVCLLASPRVRPAELRTVVENLRASGQAFGIAVEIPGVPEGGVARAVTRPSLDDLMRRPLDPPCDRMVAVYRDPPAESLSRAWIARGPSGGVDRLTHTRAYIVLQVRPFPENLAGVAFPGAAEISWLLGCSPGTTSATCHARVRRLTSAPMGHDDFFPAWTSGDTLLRRRADVETELARQLPRELHAVRQPGSMS